MRKRMIKANSIVALFISLISCSTPNMKTTFLERVDIAEWNQLTMNLLIDSFRIDTTSFPELKQRPPFEYVGVYDYSNFAEICNNDIAIAWNFLNKRCVLLKKLEEIEISHCSKIEINEYHSVIDRKVDYDITDGISCYRITIKVGKTTVEQREEQSEIVKGFVDNRGKELKPLKSLCVKSIIDFTDKKVKYSIETIYIDGGVMLR